MSLSAMETDKSQQRTESQKFQVSLKQYQENFVFSPKQFPAFIGGWGTGKSLCLILRAMLYSKHIPKNLGIIFRKEYVDLRDSTVQDFEKYTNLKVNSQREVELQNKSKILFRHIEELNNIQNLNLGWAAIEQVDELETDKEFYMLWGRLRRQVEPDEHFKENKLPYRSLFSIGNVGRDWVRKTWKENPKPDYDLQEASTFDNADVLPPEFIQNMRNLKEDKPEIYKRFVINDWESEDTSTILIPTQAIDRLRVLGAFNRRMGSIISCDPSTGGDECVIYVMHDHELIESKYMYEKDTMKIVGEIMLLSAKYEINNIAVDSIGIGQGVVDRLKELKKQVIAINSAEASSEPKLFYNKRTEMWWYTMKMIFDKCVPYMRDVELIRQLTSVKYKVVNSNGLVQLEHKSDVKKRLSRSPDRADAFVYALWASQFTTEKTNHMFKPYKYV